MRRRADANAVAVDLDVRRDADAVAVDRDDDVAALRVLLLDLAPARLARHGGTAAAAGGDGGVGGTGGRRRRVSRAVGDAADRCS
jgi:hypothetical protein